MGFDVVEESMNAEAPKPTYWQRHVAHPKPWLLKWDLALMSITGLGIGASLVLAFGFNKNSGALFATYALLCLCFVFMFLVPAVHHKYAIDKNINTFLGPI